MKLFTFALALVLLARPYSKKMKLALLWHFKEQFFNDLNLINGVQHPLLDVQQVGIAQVKLGQQLVEFSNFFLLIPFNGLQYIISIYKTTNNKNDFFKTKYLYPGGLLTSFSKKGFTKGLIRQKSFQEKQNLQKGK